ncbi:YdeI/OmpD-associated family protein [Chitinophagaceae bacterium 26-R-25]|nr:YdeI/OmpD-associated family protein [Chitinophagaceae bacterium 26-R-25]
MVKFSTTIHRFDSQGEKTGWTYIEVPAALAQKLSPGNKKTFRVKGKLDNYEFEGASLLPMGEGNFILALNATMRRGIKKRKGDKLIVIMEIDKPFEIPSWFMECIEDEPKAIAYFNSLPGSHRNYFVKWILAAKTSPTQDKRTAQVVHALINGMTYPEMLHYERDRNS